MRKVITLTVLGILIIGAIFSSSLAGCKKEATTGKELVSNGGIPGIDASAPVDIETATFALG